MSPDLPRIDDYMQRSPITFGPDDDIHDAIEILLEKRISGAPVVDAGGDLVGILSKKDCFKVVYSSTYHQDWGGRVRDYMSTNVATLASGTDLITAADRFLESSFRRFPVLEHGRMVGLITRHDLLLAISAQWQAASR